MSQISKHSGKHFEANQTLVTPLVEFVFIESKVISSLSIWKFSVQQKHTHNEKWEVLGHISMYVRLSD